MGPFTRFIARLLIVGLAWSAAQMAAAERRAETGLAEAAELLRKHLPKEAIPILVQVIEQRRDDHEQSVDALIRLVECFQLLKGDAAAERDYAMLAGKYLSRPPALDGKSLPSVEEVTEDLLWKSWAPGEESRIKITLSFAGWSESRDARGARRKTLHVTCKVMGGGPLLDGSALANGDPAKVDAVTARIDAGEHQGKVLVSPGAREALIGIDFPDLVAPMTALPEISGIIHLCQPLRIKPVDVPLRRDAGWEMEPGKGMITKLSTTPEGVVVSCRLSGSERPLPGNPAERYALLTPGGRVVRPSSTMFGGPEGNGTMVLTFGQIEQRQVDRLRVDLPLGLSWRAFQLRFTDVKPK
jgi:hypothetical protein